MTARDTGLEPEIEEDEGLDTNVLQGPNGRPLLCNQMCGTCILRPANDGAIPLRPGRLKELVNDALAGGGFVICHSTGRRGVKPAVCRGFFDRFGHLSNVLRIWGRLGGFHEVEPPSIEGTGGGQ